MNAAWVIGILGALITTVLVVRAQIEQREINRSLGIETPDSPAMAAIRWLWTARSRVVLRIHGWVVTPWLSGSTLAPAPRPGVKPRSIDRSRPAGRPAR